MALENMWISKEKHFKDSGKTVFDKEKEWLLTKVGKYLRDDGLAVTLFDNINFSLFDWLNDLENKYFSKKTISFQTGLC